MAKRFFYGVLVIPTVIITLSLLPIHGIWWIITGRVLDPYPFVWLEEWLGE